MFCLPEEVFANFSFLTFDLTQIMLSCGTSTVWTVQVHWRFGRIRNRHCSYLDDRDTKVGTLVPNYTASYHRRQGSS